MVELVTVISLKRYTTCRHKYIQMPVIQMIENDGLWSTVAGSSHCSSLMVMECLAQRPFVSETIIHWSWFRNVSCLKPLLSRGDYLPCASSILSPIRKPQVCHTETGFGLFRLDFEIVTPTVLMVYVAYLFLYPPTCACNLGFGFLFFADELNIKYLWLNIPHVIYKESCDSPSAAENGST